MNANPQSLEDASTIVSEFIYSLDNLPNEVAHLLQEIKEKEIKAQGVQFRVLLHQRLAFPRGLACPVSEIHAHPRQNITAYAEINELSAEKCALAQRIIDLVSRTRARLDSDLAKQRAPPAHALGGGLPDVEGEVYIGASRNPASQIGESLRTALGASATMPDIRAQVPTTPVVTAPRPYPLARRRRVRAGRRLKKPMLTDVVGTERRITAAPTSIKLAPVVAATPPRRSASPLTTSVAANSHSSSSHKRSRLSRQIHPREEMDVDAEGEEEGEGEDENLYCFCQKQSYGDMIACDNDDCPYEWFHLSCVQLTQPTPEKWYCRECIENSKKGLTGGATGQRKGRKR
ncbi:hypothetical protein K438DRAFT_1956883 [Mycena galopus ATCC 62051]|nr:hypothetical protein K438DRAFT_1956883 [Mycena galopus ATCC 62051]